MRKILDRSKCSTCTDALIKRVEEKSCSSFLLRMDFSGNSLLQPTEEMMIFFRLLLSVFLFYKPSLAQRSRSFNVLSLLRLASLKLLATKCYLIPFCDDHCQKYTNFMILSTQRTFMKSFVVGINEKVSLQSSAKAKTKEKNRKQIIFSS